MFETYSGDAELKETMQYVDEFFEKGGYDFLAGLENRYDCASLCSVPLFYLTKDVDNGPPQTDCFTAAV